MTDEPPMMVGAELSGRGGLTWSAAPVAIKIRSAPPGSG